MPLRYAASVPPERVAWLWPGYIPFRKVTVLDGDPGLGKSTVLVDLAARLSQGEALPNGKEHPPMGTILLMGEDGAGDTIIPRLMNADADLDRVAIRDTYPNSLGQELPPSFPSDLDKLQEDIIAARAGLVVIDPVMSYLDADINSNNDQQVRRALMPLAGLAELTGAAIVLLRHLNKSTSSSALYRGGGSIAFVGVARSALIVARDPDDPTRAVLASTKSNLGPRPPSLNFRLVGCDNGAARVTWEGHNAHTAESLMQQPEEDQGAHARACAFLTELLGDHLPMLAKEVWRHVNEAGHGRNSILKAAHTLGVAIEKAKTQAGTYSWTLPKPMCPASTGQDTINTINTINTSKTGAKSLISPISLKYLVPGGEDTSDAPPFVPPAARYPDVLVSGTYACANCALVQYMVEGGPQLCRACRAAAGHFARTAD